MSDTRYPKCLLFGWLPQKCPTHGAKLHWRGKVRQNLNKCRIPRDFMVGRGSRLYQGEMFVTLSITCLDGLWIWQDIGAHHLSSALIRSIYTLLDSIIKRCLASMVQWCVCVCVLELFVVLSIRCQMMASLLSCQNCCPAEVFHPSQGEPSFSTLRAKK